MNKTPIYVVSSMRDYGDCEIYFSADGIFASKEEAEKYIKQDAAEILAEYEDSSVMLEKAPHDIADEIDYLISMDEYTFNWRIDTFYTDKFFPCEKKWEEET